MNFDAELLSESVTRSEGRVGRDAPASGVLSPGDVRAHGEVYEELFGDAA